MRISDWSSDVCSSDLRHVRDIHGNGSAIGSVRGRGGDTGRVADVDELQAALVLAMESRDVKAEMRSTCLKIGLHANFEIIECFLVCGLIQIGRASCRERVCQYV